MKSHYGLFFSLAVGADLMASSAFGATTPRSNERSYQADDERAPGPRRLEGAGAAIVLGGCPGGVRRLRRDKGRSLGDRSPARFPVQTGASAYQSTLEQLDGSLQSRGKALF